MSYRTIDAETRGLISNGALRSLATDELLRDAANLRGKTVVITGGGSGLGRAFAVDAARNGARVVVGDINKAGLDETLRLITAVRGTAVGKICDVTSWASQLELFALAAQTYTNVDIVVANAGIGEHRPGEWDAENEARDVEGLQAPSLRTVDVDLTGVVYTSRVGLHYLRRNPARTGKTLILIASYAAFYGSPLTPMYAPAKHAVLGLGRSLRYVAANDGIRCATVCPYFIDTPLINPLRNIVTRDPLGSASDFVRALTHVCTSPAPSARAGASAFGDVVFVDPKGVLVPASGVSGVRVMDVPSLSSAGVGARL